MNKYIVDTFHDETKLFDEISSELKNNGILAQCVLDDTISVESVKNASDIIADATGRYIIDNLEEDKVYEILKMNCLTKEDADGAAKYFHDDIFNKYSRLRALKKGLKEALVSYGRINVEGLLNFRLHEYNHLLYTGTAMALEDYEAHKACEEFLGLLRYYVSIQDTEYETVVVTQKDNDYVIYDDNGEIIEDDDDSAFFDDMDLLPVKADERLIGRLINIAPNKIIINTDKDKPIIKTLERIFERKILK